MADLSFHVKSIATKDYSGTIVLQNENGPCALVAISNLLVLRDSPMAAVVNSHENAQAVSEETLRIKLGEIGDPAYIEQIIEFLPKLSAGLDVNPRFDGTFEPSPELDVFKSFHVPLVHGWVLGDIEREELGISDASLSSMSYEKFAALQFSDSPSTDLARFVAAYPSQLTPSGFSRLVREVPSGQLAVLFWNNHFSTVLNHDGQLYGLVTDLGFQNRREIIWELVDLRGAGTFLDGSFGSSDAQIRSDEELARQLANEESHREGQASALVGTTPRSSRLPPTSATASPTTAKASSTASGVPSACVATTSISATAPAPSKTAAIGPNSAAVNVLNKTSSRHVKFQINENDRGKPRSGANQPADAKAKRKCTLM